MKISSRISRDKSQISPPLCPPLVRGGWGGEGFTLVEIMIALAIVGGVVITILYTVNYHSDIAYKHTIATKMLLLAKEKIIEMEQKPQNTKGNIPETRFTYENSVAPTENENIIEIKTTIRGDDKEVVLSELVINKEIQQ